MKIVLAEPHRGVASAMKIALERTLDMEVVGIAEDGPGALELCMDCAPTALVTELRLPGLDGVALLLELRRHKPGIGISFLTGEDCAVRIQSAAYVSPEGFVHKSDELPEWKKAFLAACHGHRYFSRRIAGALHFNQERGHSLIYSLSTAERALLIHIAKGLKTTQIAALRGTSVRTVDNQRTSLRKKLNAHCVADMVRIAGEAGLI